MLKIKDNVDLKELEKFGFKLEFRGKYQYGYDKYDISIEIQDDRTLDTVSPLDYNLEDTKSFMDVLYDLIKADLIEKIEK